MSSNGLVSVGSLIEVTGRADLAGVLHVAAGEPRLRSTVAIETGLAPVNARDFARGRMTGLAHAVGIDRFVSCELHSHARTDFVSTIHFRIVTVYDVVGISVELHGIRGRCDGSKRAECERSRGK